MGFTVTGETDLPLFRDDPTSPYGVERNPANNQLFLRPRETFSSPFITQARTHTSHATAAFSSLPNNRNSEHQLQQRTPRSSAFKGTPTRRRSSSFASATGRVVFACPITSLIRQSHFNSTIEHLDTTDVQNLEHLPNRCSITRPRLPQA